MSSLSAPLQQILVETLDYLHKKAFWANRNTVNGFNLNVKNYHIQAQTGTPSSQIPQSILVASVDDIKATNIFVASENDWQNGRNPISDNLNIESAINQSTKLVPIGNILTIDASGTKISLLPDPDAPATPIQPSGSPIGAPIMGYTGVFHAAFGDKDINSVGYAYTDPSTGLIYYREQSIVWGPCYVQGVS